ncbi:hypothetical protein KQX54_006860 [Cotesia glomerata]|uniref:Uncharacterized protein n=1 Tax=Cotesia glomerata TaxID=32391 RepID=A0AAV7I7Y6_COTGL|nr:hypothetical protein KQX54_006860 [Cotesia glomerata]
MSRKLEDTDFQFAVPCGVPKRRKVEVRNSDLNGKLNSLSRSSSFSFKTPSYNENLDAAFQSVATESSSKKSECSMPRMSSFLLKDSRKPNRDRRSHSLKKMSAFSGSWPKLGSSDFKNKSRNYSKNSKADKFTIGDAGDKVDLDVTPPVGDLFDGEDDDDDDDVIKSSKDSVDLDVTPPVGDLFDDEDQDDEDDSGNKDSVDLDVTPPVGDLFDDDEDEDEDDDCKKEVIDLDKTPPVGDLFNDDDYADKSASSANSEDLQEITPPVSPSLSFGEDDFDTCKITTSDGVILKTGDEDEDSLRTSVGASRVFHVLPGDDQVTLTI